MANSGKFKRLMFPEDENGEVLRRMQESGDDLSRPREVDFTVVLPDESSAQAFLKIYREKGYQGTCKFSGVVTDLPWDVVVVKYMIPDHGEITAFENKLQNDAAELGGRNDGWGCFERSTDTQ